MKEKAGMTAPGAGVLKYAGSFVAKRRTELLMGVLYGAAAYALGGAELIFETAPLGLALVCAVKEGVPLAAAGLLISALVRGGYDAVLCISGLAVALGFRYALSFVLHGSKSSVLSLDDGLAPRIASAAAGAFTTSAIRVIYGGFRYYDLLAAAFFILCACGAVYTYSLCTDKENRNTQRSEAGYAALMFSGVLSLRGVTLFGVSAASCAAFFFTLAASRRGGALRGIVAGFLCAAATDLSLCPLFGVTGFVCGLLHQIPAYAGVLFSVIAGLFCGMQTAGFDALSSNLVPASVSSCAVIAIEYFGLAKHIGRAVSAGAVSPPALISGAAALSDQLFRVSAGEKKLADALRSISEVTAEISAAQRRPDKKALVSVCSDTFFEFCGQCRKRYACFPDSGRISRAELDAVAAAIKEKSGAARLALPENVKNNCKYREIIAVKLELRCSEQIKKLTETDTAGVISSDCDMISKLLYARFDGAGRAGFDTEKSSAAAALPYFRELFSGDVSVFSDKRKIYMTAAGPDLKRIKQSRDELRKTAECALGVKLAEPEISSQDGKAVFRTESAPLYDYETASYDKAKKTETVNGDTAFYTECDGVLYCAVCDGMGSGRDAAASSRLTGVVLGRLLYAGCGRPDALQMLNQIMRQRRTECFSTVDLFEFDTLDGSAVFYKCGASPTFILRDGKVYRIASHTPPVGIMTELHAEKIGLKLQPSDVVVMASDGVTDQEDQCGWICTVLCELDGSDPEKICGAIMEEAENRSGRADDMTVLAVRIKKAGA
ncbi:MAG: SpoIIE family protein phosphatase [Clostridia bacterium]|nr:SpoIIE family protein phosphatase [Clostridia bacterium]